MKPFLRWWLIVSAICVGLAFFLIYDGLNFVNNADFTKLSFVIFAIFVYCSIQVGICTYREKDDLAIPVWFASMFPKIGMIGTVIGFIVMLKTCLLNININNTSQMQSILAEMSLGMSTALVTTAAGLICSVLLHLQIFSFERGVCHGP
jgi:hypothetical protein